jgi:hypothetical protein
MIRLGLIFVTVAGAPMFAVAAASAQGVACCNQHIWVNGPWTGMSRVEDCQKYFNEASPLILRNMCQQRSALTCINTGRCDELTPEDTASQHSSGDNSVPPSDTDRDGLETGFYGPPPADAPAAPAAPPVMPRRLVYIAAWGGQGDKASKTFTAWLDGAGCPLPLDKDNRLADPAAAKHVVRGKVTHRDGRVRVEAEAQARPGGGRIGPVASESDGEDAAAVMRATRGVIDQLKLVCAR